MDHGFLSSTARLNDRMVLIPVNRVQRWHWSEARFFWKSWQKRTKIVHVLETSHECAIPHSGLGWTCFFQINVGKTIINHPSNHHFYRWYKPFPNGWFPTLFYPHYLGPEWSWCLRYVVWDHSAETFWGLLLFGWSCCSICVVVLWN